ncbi:Putative quinoprotein amine dehydrogenase, beta chain [Septoria linicola]|uniref:Quinoprotein amine dehydrogenase, beta chain n=1 Tax=Septoria linicola TaxID=215465 RepID=A0A9Q9B1A0_9PEZI|nr:Putative quinoprotein amine dehydrogenase, beta chain [Septoria linicola]
MFTPHGLAVDYLGGYIWTSDFVVPASVLKPSPFGSLGGDTVRLWDVETRTILNAVEIPNGGGIQDVKIIPGNPDFAAVATAVALGQIWIIYPKRVDPATGKPGVAELLFDLGPEARETTAIFSALTNDGKYMYVTYTTGNHVAALDISDLNNIKRLDDPNEAQPITGPHSTVVFDLTDPANPKYDSQADRNAPSGI